MDLEEFLKPHDQPIFWLLNIQIQKFSQKFPIKLIINTHFNKKRCQLLLICFAYFLELNLGVIKLGEYFKEGIYDFFKRHIEKKFRRIAKIRVLFYGLKNKLKIGSFPQNLSMHNIFHSILDVDNFVINVFTFYHSVNC